MCRKREIEMKARAHFSTVSGSALLLSLWALLLLSAVVFAWVKFINANITVAAEANFGLQARALAHSGVQIAMNPAITSPTDPLLQQTIAPDRSYRVTLKHEDGKLNLNWLLQGPVARQNILKSYLQLRGLKLAEYTTFVDSLLVWIGAPGSHPSGAQESDNYHPPGRGSLLTLEEIKQVNGSEPLVSQPGWSDDFTLYPQNAPINLQYASSLVLQSLPTASPISASQAQRLIDYRAGPDKIDGTGDDNPVKDAATTAQYLNLPASQLTAIAALVTYRAGTTYRAVSVGHAANRTRQVEVVFTQGGAQSQIFLWKEF